MSCYCFFLLFGDVYAITLLSHPSRHVHVYRLPKKPLLSFSHQQTRRFYHNFLVSFSLLDNSTTSKLTPTTSLILSIQFLLCRILSEVLVEQAAIVIWKNPNIKRTPHPVKPVVEFHLRSLNNSKLNHNLLRQQHKVKDSNDSMVPARVRTQHRRVTLRTTVLHLLHVIMAAAAVPQPTPLQGQLILTSNLMQWDLTFLKTLPLL